MVISTTRTAVTVAGFSWIILFSTLVRGAGDGPAAQPSRRKSRAMRRVEQVIARMRKGKKPSRSAGTLGNGRLENALQLPVTEAFGYRVLHARRQAHFGADRMVFGLMTLGVRMRELSGPSGLFVVGDISARDGGKLSPHINHQMGLDVDLGFYVTDPSGKPLGNRMAAFGRDGWSKGRGLRFDARRNWWFVASMIESRHFAEVRFILLADWLKKLLLDHARHRLKSLRDPRHVKRQEALIEQAEKLIVQPKSSPHDNHYHLSLKKPAQP